MLRSHALQPLSREHHAALKLAKVCERAALSAEGAQVSRACQQAIQAYASELEAHFLIEELTLLPLLSEPLEQALVARTLADHRQLHALLVGLHQHDAEALNNFGKCLTAHVRFEERELFPVLERKLAIQN
jgi:hemerythrin-like domain-containing protein